MSNKLPWFTHDHDAHQDIQLRAAVRKHGHVAGWAWWVLLELMHKHGVGDSLEMHLSDMAASMMVDRRTFRSVCETLHKLGMVTSVEYVEGKHVVCTLIIEKFRKRQSKLKFKVPPTLRQHSIKVHEEEEREEEGHKDLTPSAAPQSRTPIQMVVIAYKEVRGIHKDDKGWDKNNFSRCSKSAKAILEAFGGKVPESQAYTIVKAQEFQNKGLDFTLETIARHAWDNKGNLGGQDGLEQQPVDANRVLEPRGHFGVASAGKLIGPALRAIRQEVLAGEQPTGAAGRFVDRGDGFQVPSKSVLAPGNGPDGATSANPSFRGEDIPDMDGDI